MCIILLPIFFIDLQETRYSPAPVLTVEIPLQTVERRTIWTRIVALMVRSMFASFSDVNNFVYFTNKKCRLYKGYTAMSPHIGYPGIGTGDYPGSAYTPYSASYACGYPTNTYLGTSSGYSQSPCYNMPPPPPQHSKLSTSSKEDRYYSYFVIKRSIIFFSIKSKCILLFMYICL